MPWLWSSPTLTGNAKAGPSTPLQPIETAPPASESSAGPSSKRVDEAPSPAAQQARSVSATASAAPGSAPARYERLLKDEETYQAKQFPSFEEVPGCMQLFDEFMMCYALVPQLRSFYRRGEFHDCSWKFRDFKYCLSLKSEPEDRRVELWTKRRAEWWATRRFEGSSEDVWDVREKPPANFPPVYTEEEADVKIVT